MGFFDFVKSAGERIFGRDEPEVAATPAGPSPDELKARALEDHVRGHELDIESLSVRFGNGLATVSGRAKTQLDRERAILIVGNVEGVHRVDDQMETIEPPEPPAVFYTVARGDTLSKIAKQHYGSAMKYPAIFEANRPMLSDPDKIYPGQVLRIPKQG